jgi:hypothetical protein
VSLLWAVPVVAAAAATVLVVAWTRPLEDAAVVLAREVRRFRQVERPLGSVRAAMVETDEVTAGFRRRHVSDAAPAGPDPSGTDPPGTDPSGDGTAAPGTDA